MSIRLYIVLSRTILIVLLSAMLCLGALGLQKSLDGMQRLEFANRQLILLTCLSASVNEVSMQVGRLFIPESTPRFDIIDKSRTQMSSLTSSLKEATDKEYKWLAGAPESVGESNARERIQLLIGQTGATAALFTSIIEIHRKSPEQGRHLYLERLNREMLPALQTTIKHAIKDEQEKILEIRIRTKKALYFYAATSLTVLLTIIIFLFLTAIWTYRSLAVPVAGLIRAATGFRKGRAGDRIAAPSNPTEIKMLVRACNKLTQEMRAKQDLMETQNADLEAQIAARTEELITANAKLQQLDKMRVKFLANVGHELKTPLTALKGEAEIILRRKDHDEQEYRSTLTRIKVLCEQMNVLVDDILFLSRSEADTIHFDFKKTDLEGVVSGVVETYTVLALENNVELDVQWADQPVEIMSDVSRLKQALGIILDNAIKYAFANTRIEIEIQSCEQQVVLTIRNQGQHIPREDLPYLFERFYRGNTGNSRNGVGLGLAIAKWIIEKHRGTIQITSSRKGVTEVTTTFPERNQSEVME